MKVKKRVFTEVDHYFSPNSTFMSLGYFISVVQCAAVSTCRGDIRLPPQNGVCWPSSTRAAYKKYLSTIITIPPIVLSVIIHWKSANFLLSLLPAKGTHFWLFPCHRWFYLPRHYCSRMGYGLPFHNYNELNHILKRYKIFIMIKKHLLINI